MNRNLLNNEENGNATSILGIPISDNPQPINGDVIVFENNELKFQSFVPGDINSIQNIGPGAQLYAGEVSNVAQFYTLSNTDQNVICSNNVPGQVININTNPNFTCTNLTVSNKVTSPLTVESTTPGLTFINSSCNPSSGSLSLIGIGDFSSSKGYSLIYDRDSESLVFSGSGDPSPPSGNITIANNQEISVMGTQKLALQSDTEIEINSPNITSDLTGTTINGTVLINGITSVVGNLNVETPNFLLTDNISTSTVGADLNITSNLVNMVNVKPDFITDKNDSTGLSTQYLTNNSGITWKQPELIELSDVNISSPVNDQFLKYNGTQWINDRGYPYYKTVYTGDLVINPALANNHYIPFFGGTITIDPLNVGDYLMITASVDPITINFTGTSFVNTLGGGSPNPTIVFNNATIELVCEYNDGQTYYSIIRISQNRTGSAATINGQKISALAELDDIPNVVLSSPASNQVLTYDGTNWINANLPAADVTIYSGDGIILGNRIIDMGGYNLRFEDGTYQINTTDMTNNSTTAQNFILTSSSSGLLKAYSLTQTNNSIRFSVALQNLTMTDNIINVYSAIMAANSTFIADIYLSSQGGNNTISLQWKLTANISSDTGWQTIPMIQSNIINSSATGNSYILQGRIGEFSVNEIYLRLVRVTYNGINPGADGTMTIIRRDIDNNSNTYSLLTQTPYNEITINYILPLLNIERNRNANFTGFDLTTMGSKNFTYQVGMTLILSASITFDYIPGGGSNTVTILFYINGNNVLASPTLSQQFALGINNCTLSWHNMDVFEAGTQDLIQSGVVVPGNNVLTATISGGFGTLITADRFYNITISSSF